MVRRRAIVQCEFCDKRFTTKSLYKAHQKKVHGVKKWSCEFCGRRFAERGTLTNHVRTHTKETPFGCDLCGRRFGHRATLLNHKKIHSQTKEHQCTYCQKRFHRKSNMNRHIQVVHMAKGGKKRRRRPMPSRLAMPPMISDQSSDGSPMQNPVRMPPPPLPLNIVMQQMGFPTHLKSGFLGELARSPRRKRARTEGRWDPDECSDAQAAQQSVLSSRDVMRTLMSLPKLPERVTLSVTYQQQQQMHSSRSPQQPHSRDFQSASSAHGQSWDAAPVPPPVRFARFPVTPQADPRRHTGRPLLQKMVKRQKPYNGEDLSGLLRKLGGANMLPPALKFRGQMQTLTAGMNLRPITPSKIPPVLPPKEDKRTCTMVKEEPIDGYSVPAAPPSLHQSRSTSPIITGCDDLMLKGEDDTPTPSPAHINGGAFSFPKSKSECPSFKLPTPMRRAEQSFFGKFGRFGTPTPVGSAQKFAFGKRDSIPDKMKFGGMDQDFAPDYVASAMTMTMCVPSPLMKQTFTYEQTQGT